MRVEHLAGRKMLRHPPGDCHRQSILSERNRWGIIRWGGTIRGGNDAKENAFRHSRRSPPVDRLLCLERGGDRAERSWNFADGGERLFTG